MLVPHGQLPVRPSTTQQLRNQGRRLRRVELGDVSLWHYILGVPLAGQVNPFGIPDAQVPNDAKAFYDDAGVGLDTLTTSFVNSWANAPMPNGSYAPLSFRVHPATKVRLVGHIDGGAFGDPCILVPDFARPRFDLTTIMTSGDGTAKITVTVVASTGEVIPIGTV